MTSSRASRARMSARKRAGSASSAAPTDDWCATRPRRETGRARPVFDLRSRAQYPRRETSSPRLPAPMPKNEPFALPAPSDEDAAPAVSSPISETVLGDDAFDAIDDEPLDGGDAPRGGDPAPSPLRRFRALLV